ncbi:hypothetical protein L208DRAFT_1393168 [Tricholoma matsutake]|nr:hypothetical protein L208DRAFT_1393168 [Tricholoma matsutake 945]
MVGRRISPDIKECALRLWEAGWDHSEVCWAFNHTDTYLDELQWFLAIHHDIVISISALQVNLDKAGLTRKILHKIAKERDEECRAAYCHCIQNGFSGTGGEFVAIDESSKIEHDVAQMEGSEVSQHYTQENT